MHLDIGQTNPYGGDSYCTRTIYESTRDRKRPDDVPGAARKGMRDSAGIVHEDAWVGANCEAVFVALD